MDVEQAIQKLSSYFPNTPEAELCLAVIERAIIDIGGHDQISEEDKRTAREYLSGEILHAQLYGVSPALVKSILAEASYMPSEWDLKQRGELV